MLNASYIKVTSTRSKSMLRAIKHKLNAMGLPMTYRTTSKSYNVYSGPYKTKRHTIYAFKKIKRYFPRAAVLQTTNKKKTKALYNKKRKNLKNKYYANIALVYSSAPLTQTIQSGTLKINEPKNTGMSILLEGGINLNYNLSTGIGYARFATSDLVFNNIYGVVNYAFTSYKDITPYFGVIAGYSSLSWNKDPISNATADSNNDSTSPYYGTQAGVKYSGFNIGDIYVSYQCLFMSHTTTIEVDSSNISKLQHNILHSLQIGYQYKF
jgi:hypothetical protein